MQGDTQIRAHKIGKNSVIEKRLGARGLERPFT